MHFGLFYKNYPDGSIKKRIFAFVLSLLLHGIGLLIFIIIELEYIDHKKDTYTTITFIEVNPYQSIQKKEAELQPERDIVRPLKKKEPTKSNLQADETTIKVSRDTSENRQEIYVTETETTDSSNENLKFAESLLDSFLILYPEYSRYILKEQAKNIKGNPNDKRFSRIALEKRINDELHKYISEKFPEGSQHEINKYTGPGLNIPIGDLIDIIRKIFQ